MRVTLLIVLFYFKVEAHKLDGYLAVVPLYVLYCQANTLESDVSPHNTI